MLFDLKGKRKRVVQVVYLGLAILFGGSLVLFGTGSSVSGGLIDAITGNGGGGSNSVFQDQVESTQKRVRANPKSEQAWLDLARADVQPRRLAGGLGPADRAAHRQGQAGGARRRPRLGALPEAEAQEAGRRHGPVRRARLRGAPGLRQGGEDPGDRRQGAAERELLLPARGLRLPRRRGQARATRRRPRRSAARRRTSATRSRPDQGRARSRARRSPKADQAGRASRPRKQGKKSGGAASARCPGTGTTGASGAASASALRRPPGRPYNRPSSRRRGCRPGRASRAVSSTGRAGDS